MTSQQLSTSADDRVYITAYTRDDGSVVVHVETPGVKENKKGPELTIYLNDDLDNPLWDNGEHE